MSNCFQINRILGWDAAWTPGGTGAWCLIDRVQEEWRVSWNRTSPKGEELLTELENMLQQDSPDLVAVDLPVAHTPVRHYREADRATTRAFSRYGCPVHSPTPERPGPWGDQIMEVFKRHHVQVATSTPLSARSLVEVYPHTVCLDIVRAGYRVPYKIQRASRFYPHWSARKRQEAIARTLTQLLHAVEDRGLVVPEELWEPPPLPLRHWKTREDRVDALLCALAGIGISEGRFLPFGSSDSAIWNPDLKHLAPPDRVG